MRTALITGATAGIGEAAARAFVDAGWRVIGTGRRRARLDALAGELGDAFHSAAFDIRDEAARDAALDARSEEHTSELQSLMRISYAGFCLKKKKNKHRINTTLITSHTI